MARTLSRWRAAARQVIRDTLATLPADLAESQVRKAIKNAYPFGEREHHPYKAWLAEVKDALFWRFGRRANAPERPTVAFRLQSLSGLPWLVVRCGWCEGKQGRRGSREAPDGLGLPGTPAVVACLLCGDQVADLLRVVANPLFRAMQASCKGPVAGWAPLRDWLAEVYGIEAEVPS